MLAVAGTANDGWIGVNGAPRIEGKHPSIRMVDEVIHLKVGKKSVTADCRFTFKNEGTACTARIGFPDYDYSESTKTIFDYFKSYVDGKRVATKYVGSNDGENWQVKHVKFAKGQTRRIRNVYRLSLGALTIGQGDKLVPMISRADYIVSTGRSWKGRIGSSKVIVEFEDAAKLKTPIKLAKLESKAAESDAFWTKNKSTVMWTGFATPKVSGRRITFEKKNWEPTEDDDVFLLFGRWIRDVWTGKAK